MLASAAALPTLSHIPNQAFMALITGHSVGALIISLMFCTSLGCMWISIAGEMRRSDSRIPDPATCRTRLSSGAQQKRERNKTPFPSKQQCCDSSPYSYCICSSTRQCNPTNTNCVMNIDNYQEDVTNNIFFKAIKRTKLYALVEKNCWFICVPQSSVASGIKITQETIGRSFN